MPPYVVIDAHGWCDGVLELSGAAIHLHPIRAGSRIEAVDPALAHVLQRAGRHAFRTATGWKVAPVDALIPWFAHWRIPAEAAHEDLARRAAGMRDLPLVVAEPHEVPPAPAVQRAAHFEPTELRPGLVIREMTPAESALFADEAAASGLYAEQPDVMRRRAHLWCYDAKAWPLAVTWQGRPLELEVYHFGKDPASVFAGFTLHVQHDRPHWFWREVEAPVFDALQLAGVKRIISHVRGDRKDWIEILKATYGAVETGQIVAGRFVELEYDVVHARSLCRGWPARRSVPAWTWREGQHALREATDADLPAVRAALAAAWGDRPRGAVVLDLLETRWALDQASVLIGSEDDAIADIFVVRERRTALASVATLMPWRLDTPTQGLLRYAATAWQDAAGYEDTSSFTPQWMATHPEWPRHWRRLGMRTHAKHDSWREPWIELRGNVQALLRRPRGEWTR